MITRNERMKKMKIDFIKTGNKEFDTAIGFAKGTITVVNSKVGQGKTTFLIKLANLFSDAKNDVLFCGSHTLFSTLKTKSVCVVDDMLSLKNILNKRTPDIVIIDDFNCFNPTLNDMGMLKNSYKNIVFVVTNQLDSNGNDHNRIIQVASDNILELTKEKGEDMKIKVCKSKFYPVPSLQITI